MENGRILGGVGALLMFIGIFPYINYLGVIELVGLVLVIIALHNLSRYYEDRGIFNSALYGLIIGIIGGITSLTLLIFTVLTSLAGFLHTIFPDWNGDWTALSGLTPDMSKFSLQTVMPFLAGIFTAFIITWVFSIIATFFVRRSLVKLSAKSGVGLFSTAGLLLLIGAVLIVAFGIGLLLIWISTLLLAIAFFQIKPQQAQPATYPKAQI